MCYLKRTKGYMLTYQKFENLEIIGYSDSDFVGCQDNKCSTYGYIFMLARGVISWKYAKQTPIASSTMVAEFITYFEESYHRIWLGNFVIGLGVVDGIERPLKIYCDNKSTVLYSNNNRSTTKSKFNDIKFFVVKERVQNKQIFIKHLRTNDMLNNPLTKGLVPKVFHEHIAHMGVVPYSILVQWEYHLCSMFYVFQIFVQIEFFIK